MHNPSKIDVIKTIIAKEEPTAAKAFVPINFPTIIESTTLYNC